MGSEEVKVQAPLELEVGAAIVPVNGVLDGIEISRSAKVPIVGMAAVIVTVIEVLIEP